MGLMGWSNELGKRSDGLRDSGDKGIGLERDCYLVINGQVRSFAD